MTAVAAAFDGIEYAHRVVLTRAPDEDDPEATGAGQDPDTGQPTGPGGVPVTDVTVYDGPADVQDAGESVPRGATGQPIKKADATVFLPEEQRDALLDIRPDDRIVVYYPDSDRSADGEVVFVRELDESFTIRFV